MMEIKKRDNQLWIGDKHYDFEHSIEKIAVFSQLIILMFWERNKVLRDNIIVVDYAGSTQWNISDIIKFNYAEAYVALSKESDDIFSVTTYNGVKFYIDADKKQIIKKKITR